MTREERLRVYIRNTVSPMAFVRSAASAGIGQWRDRPRGWGQGGEAYGKRAASAFVQHFESESMLFVLSAELHEDNRYFASGLFSPGDRVKHALASSFLARRDDGSRRFSRSRLFAVVGIAILSRTWQPRGNRNVRGAFINAGTSYGVNMGFNVAREFVPQIFNRH